MRAVNIFQRFSGAGIHCPLERRVKKIAGFALAWWFSLCSGAAVAVELSSNGMGQALIYPYYNAQVDGYGQAYNTLLSVANSTSDAKAVHVNIREGTMGYIVSTFNIFLGPNDTWVAVIVPDTSSGPKGVKILTPDLTCTAGRVVSEGLGQEADLRSGYIELIEMATIPSETIAYWKLFGRGKGEQCPSEASIAVADITGPNTGGLSGSLTLVNVQKGVSFSMQAVALDRFASPGAALGYVQIGDSIWPKSDIKPDLTSAAPVSRVRGDGDEALLISEWKAGTADAVSAALMHAEVVNEYVTDNSLAAATDWVVTFPTKPYYYEKQWATASNGKSVRYASGLFQRDMEKDYGACDDFDLKIRGREEERSSGCGLLCYPKPKFALCTVSQAVSIRGPSTGSRQVFPLGPSSNTQTSTYDNGYVNGSFLPVKATSTAGRAWTAHRLTSEKTTAIRSDGTVLKDQTRSFVGLPMVGFAAQTFNNSTITLPDGKAVRSIYGVTVPHTYRSMIE